MKEEDVELDDGQVDSWGLGAVEKIMLEKNSSKKVAVRTLRIGMRTLGIKRAMHFIFNGMCGHRCR